MTLDFTSAEITTSDIIVPVNTSIVLAVYVNHIIIRPHRSTAYVRPIVADVIAYLSVVGCRS